MTQTILLLGGSGVFGLRLARRLVETTGHALIIAGRSQPRCEASVAALKRLNPAAMLRGFTVHRDTITAATIRHLGATILVDAAGPFQASSLALARAAIDAGCHFIDIADARAYVAQFTELDAAARRRGVRAITGASSTPALSNAALDAITAGWRQVESAGIAICPGNRTPRGLSVMQAILSYAGQPVRVREDGTWRTRPGWSLLHRRLFPGLGRRFLSLCETPDLDIIPARYPGIQTVRFFGGLELGVLHLGLSLCCWPVRAGLLKSLLPAARPFLHIANWFEPFGSDSGGMLVQATGLDAQGKPITAQWSLLATAGDGPNIPILPALALLRQVTNIPPGAFNSAGLLRLGEIEQEFVGLQIKTEVSTSFL